MKQIKFNEPKILKALLNKTKVTTLRKAWIDAIYYNEIDGEILKDVEEEEKPCKYKIGEVVELVWTGRMSDSGIVDNWAKKNLPNPILAKAKITSIEKVEIARLELNMKHPFEYFDFEKRKWSRFGVCAKALSKSEGFESVEDMFNFLEKYSGGLEVSKPFWLITYAEIS